MYPIDDRLIRLSQRLDLPPEAVGRDSQLLFSGTHQLTVEGHRGIRLYSPERMEIRTLRGCAVVEGQSLQVSFLSTRRLSICGTIRALTLEDGR